MKTYLSIAIIAVIMVLIVSCSTQHNSETEVVLVRDITDRFLSQPKSNEITSLFGLDNDQWEGVKFRFVDITDVSYNQISEASIKPENQWLSNEFDRRKKIKSFYTEVSQILNSSEKQVVGKENSSVYFPIAKELNRLNQSNSTKKILLVYSDLMENTAEMSFYDNTNFSLLKTNSNSIKKYFDSQIELKNLNGINIYIIFQPNGIGEDEQFKVVSGFYKSLYESKGAKVEITASID